MLKKYDCTRAVLPIAGEPKRSARTGRGVGEGSGLAATVAVFIVGGRGVCPGVV